MQLPPVLADANVVALAGKIVAGGGVAAALFMVGRVLLKVQAISTWAWLGAIFSFLLAGLALTGIVDVNIRRALELGRLGLELGAWVQRNFGVRI
jgi:hypothetical protein